jgi:hypothetical protein
MRALLLCKSGDYEHPHAVMRRANCLTTPCQTYIYFVDNIHSLNPDASGNLILCVQIFTINLINYIFVTSSCKFTLL